VFIGQTSVHGLYLWATSRRSRLQPTVTRVQLVTNEIDSRWDVVRGTWQPTGAKSWGVSLVRSARSHAKSTRGNQHPSRWDPRAPVSITAEWMLMYQKIRLCSVDKNEEAFEGIKSFVSNSYALATTWVHGHKREQSTSRIGQEPDHTERSEKTGLTRSSGS
jgi:hypothetical protein